MSIKAIARSEAPGIAWPGVPPMADSLVFALLQQFEQSQWWPAPVLLEHQLRQLGALVAHAAATTPYYADRLRSFPGLGAEPTLEAFRGLPILTRAQLQANAKALVSRALPKDHGDIDEVRTSGSTGRPVAVKVSTITALFARALNMRFHIWHGREFSRKAAMIVGLRSPSLIRQAEQGVGFPWAFGFHSAAAVQFDIMRPVPEQLDWLVREDPDYLLTYPSNLRALLDVSREIGVRPRRLQEAILMGEVVDPGVPKMCRDEWGVRSSANYSAREIGYIAIQCREASRYHIQSENVFVEILDEEGEPCRPGEVGRVVVTDLHNFAMPLIRYEVSDYAELGGACPCGRGLPVLERVVGRAMGMMVLPSGDRVAAFINVSDGLNEIAPIRQMQFIQKTVTEIDVKLVLAERPVPDAEDRLRVYFAKMLRYPFKFNFIYVDHIPRSPGGK